MLGRLGTDYLVQPTKNAKLRTLPPVSVSTTDGRLLKMALSTRSDIRFTYYSYPFNTLKTWLSQSILELTIADSRLELREQVLIFLATEEKQFRASFKTIPQRCVPRRGSRRRAVRLDPGDGPTTRSLPPGTPSDPTPPGTTSRPACYETRWCTRDAPVVVGPPVAPSTASTGAGNARATSPRVPHTAAPFSINNYFLRPLIRVTHGSPSVPPTFLIRHSRINSMVAGPETIRDVGSSRFLIDGFIGSGFLLGWFLLYSGLDSGFRMHRLNLATHRLAVAKHDLATRASLGSTEEGTEQFFPAVTAGEAGEADAENYCCLP
ncbi:hypothetical protein FIBSPDRAFT_904302 [Athelia psychrophila]|uniref:Uncharacterized protein n=1 Tax=Athelia psychrophila TaxID=1759441 RepID=A0A167UXE2_9AGAM|nr:hypothetical protein FIBSPDRAFT_904302 [Fibularhizoctonia sp. CBS 109695]